MREGKNARIQTGNFMNQPLVIYIKIFICSLPIWHGDQPRRQATFARAYRIQSYYLVVLHKQRDKLLFML